LFTKLFLRTIFCYTAPALRDTAPVINLIGSLRRPFFTWAIFFASENFFPTICQLCYFSSFWRAEDRRNSFFRSPKTFPTILVLGHFHLFGRARTVKIYFSPQKKYFATFLLLRLLSLRPCPDRPNYVFRLQKYLPQLFEKLLSPTFSKLRGLRNIFTLVALASVKSHILLSLNLSHMYCITSKPSKILSFDLENFTVLDFRNSQL
jgi:hypothetical protein